MDPRAEYEARQALRLADVASADARFGLIGNLRVATVLATVATVWGLSHVDENALYAAPLLFVFLALVLVHEKVAQRRVQARRAVDYYARGLARLAGAWVGTGDEGLHHVPKDHPYAFDVDAFGRGSLYALLSEARTQSGDQTLAAWLLAPAPVEELVLRQAAVAELAPEVDLRELLALRAGEASDAIAPRELRAWAELAPALQEKTTRLLVRLISLASIAALVAWAVFGVSPLFLAASCLVAAFVTRSIQSDVAAVSNRVWKARNELRALMHVLSCFAGRSGKCAWLEERYARFAGAEAALAKLVRLIDWLETRRNQLFAPFAFILCWAPQFAFALEDWRTLHGKEVLKWLRVAGELEAVSALSRQAFEHPTDVFPDIVAAGEPALRAEHVRHPLMPVERCVANTVSLEAPMRLFMVSGSNMSGKSTLLRTLGLNVVLALAGGKVRAKSFRLTRLQIAATLRVQDSLHDGASRFFAEIARLKLVADCAANGPTLFLLDEILSGTNSHDRRIGTEAVVRSLLARGSIGLVTTHDLALTEIVDSLGGRATNVHFEDQMTGTTLAFDYTMRPGVVQKSNAIALMRAVGLEV